MERQESNEEEEVRNDLKLGKTMEEAVVARACLALTWVNDRLKGTSTNIQERIQISNPRRSGYDDPSSPRCIEKG